MFIRGVAGIHDAEKGIPVILDCLISSIRYSEELKHVQYPARFNESDVRPMVVIKEFLTEVSAMLDKPLIIFFVEADCLSQGTLISFLRQLRNGYNTRVQTPFVHSLALVGMRNIRDYKAQIRPNKDTLGNASPFNIVTKSLTLLNFTQEEVQELYNQHTADTGQAFEEDAAELAFQQTQGQPWLVNAIARKADYSKT